MSEAPLTARECDVLVIGYGGAGASTAIEASDAGAEVLVVERAAEGGGNTRDSGGSLRTVKDVKLATDHFYALTYGSTPRDVMEVFVRGIQPMLEWLEANGAVLSTWVGIGGFPTRRRDTAYPGIPGSEGLGHRLRVAPKGAEAGGGQALWDVLHAAVNKRNIPVLYGVRARRLLRNADGRVIGARLDTDEGEVAVHARKGVVLCCGGFSSSREMQKQFFGMEMPTFSPPGQHAGDGVKMAQDIGADLWHMNAAAAVFGYIVPGLEASWQHRMPSPGYIYVDHHGRRFVDEAGLDNHAMGKMLLQFDPIRGEYPRIPSYIIFDEVTRTSGPICHIRGGYNRRFKWSQDNSEEIARGWIHRSETVSELAELIGLDAGVLTATVERYNANCRAGADEDFGRTDGLQALETPPYYAVKAEPCLLNTQGGPRRDARARILDVFGEPIPGLFGAGELGSIWSSLYPGSGNISEALIFGRIAGREAASSS
jgi:succinate dehydrogenase/fumarate reductase flavoprotein subunit